MYGASLSFYYRFFRNTNNFKPQIEKKEWNERGGSFSPGSQNFSTSLALVLELCQNQEFLLTTTFFNIFKMIFLITQEGLWVKPSNFWSVKGF